MLKYVCNVRLIAYNYTYPAYGQPTSFVTENLLYCQGKEFNRGGESVSTLRRKQAPLK